MKYYTKCEACESFDKCRSFDYLKLIKAEGYIGEHYIEKPSVVCNKEFTCNDCKHLDCDYRSREIGRLNACGKGHIPFVKCEDFVDENEPQGCEFCHGEKHKNKPNIICKAIPLQKTANETDMKDCQIFLHETDSPALVVFDRFGKAAFININFCPICGRKLEE